MIREAWSFWRLPCPQLKSFQFQLNYYQKEEKLQWNYRAFYVFKCLSSFVPKFCFPPDIWMCDGIINPTIPNALRSLTIIRCIRSISFGTSASSDLGRLSKPFAKDVFESKRNFYGIGHWSWCSLLWLSLFCQMVQCHSPLVSDMSVDPFLWEKPRVLKKGKVQVATGHCMHLASLTQQMSACGTARVNSELCWDHVEPYFAELASSGTHNSFFALGIRIAGRLQGKSTMMASIASIRKGCFVM